MSARGRTRPKALPEVAALASLESGAELASALAALQPPALPGHDLVLVLRAWQRLANHVRACQLATIGEIMLRKDPAYGLAALEDVEAPEVDEVGMNEVRAALTLSRQGANNLCTSARVLATRLRPVLAEMAAGNLDHARARVFERETDCLADAHATAVAQALAPVAGKLTPGQLVDAIRLAAVELDPQWARRRYERAVAGRRVEIELRADGTADIHGCDLPVEQAAMAGDRLDALARAVKRAGHPARLRVLRAEIFLGKLDGRYDGLSDEELFAHLLNHFNPPDPRPPAGPEDATPSTMDGEAGGSPAGSAAEPGTGAPEDRGRSDTTTENAAANPGTTGADRSFEPSECAANTTVHGSSSTVDGTAGTVGSGADGFGDHNANIHNASTHNADGHNVSDHNAADDVGRRMAARPMDNPGPGSDPNYGGPPRDDGAPRVATKRVATRGLRLVADLTSVAGLDSSPGELLGWGILHVELTRRLAANPRANWYVTLVESDGTLLHVAPLRRRPAPGWVDGPVPDHAGLECWLRLTRADLSRLQADPPAGWDAVITELTYRVTEGTSGPPNDHPTDRLPNTALRRWIHVRDRHCVFPGCRNPAHHTEADHTIEHAHGGPTTDVNLGGACKADHRLRHEGGWTVRQPRAGHFRWTSVLGHDYDRTPPAGPDQRRAPMPRPTTPDQDRPPRYDDGDTDHPDDTCVIGYRPGTVPPSADDRPRPDRADDPAQAPGQDRRRRPVARIVYQTLARCGIDVNRTPQPAAPPTSDEPPPF
jgi:hypothetical protein